MCLITDPVWLIILGGTNDLGWGIAPPVIMENLKFFYEQSQTHGILPVAVTVPSLRDNLELDEVFDKGQSLGGITPAVERAIGLRVVLNQSIKDLGSKKSIPVVDWFTETCENGTQALAAEYSNDGLHLNTIGYKKLAELVWTQVLEDFLKKENNM